MATATRWTMRQEPYDPDARDADNDGIVQEQTPWERPAGTNLVDDLGRAITRGSNATQRPRGMRVVDRQGNPVDYTPTYERPGGGFGAGGGTPLGEAGAPSLRERGLPSVRDITAPRPAPEPEAPIRPVQAPEAPESSALRLDGGPKASAQEMTEASRIAKSIQESVEAEFGPITTRQQAEDALKKAFPSANMRGLIDSAGGSWDEDTSRVKAVRNFTIGLLHMSQQDPQTAARITSINGLDTKDPNAAGLHSVAGDLYTGRITSWQISMNPFINVNTMEPEKREEGEPWAFKMALSMKESGQFSDDEINQILQQSVAIHEFGHAMHVNAGLSHWGSDEGGAIPTEAMIQAFADMKNISVADATDEINAYIEKNFTKPPPSDAITRTIAEMVDKEPDGGKGFMKQLMPIIKWDGVAKDETTRAKILEDLKKASEYAGTGGKVGMGSQYDEGIAETIAVMVGTGTPANGEEETIAHIQSIFPGFAAPSSPDKPEAPSEPRTQAYVPAKVSSDSPEELVAFWKDDIRELEEKIPGWNWDYKTGDRAARAISQKQGFDGLPRVLSSDDWDDLVKNKEGHTFIFRGMADPRASDEVGKSGADMATQFRSGEHYVGFGIFGNGYYSSTYRPTAEHYANEVFGSTGTGKVGGGAVLDMALIPDAKIIKYDDLEALVNDPEGPLQQALQLLDGEDREAFQRVTLDPGRAAQILGYDAIEVPNAERMTPGQVDLSDGESHYVILNRTAIVVKERSDSETARTATVIQPPKFNDDGVW